MLSTREIMLKFDSLAEFEQFRIHWVRKCAMLNPKSKNGDRMKEYEERYEMLDKSKEKALFDF